MVKKKEKVLHLKKITDLIKYMKKGLKFVILEIHYVKGLLGRKLLS